MEIAGSPASLSRVKQVLHLCVLRRCWQRKMLLLQNQHLQAWFSQYRLYNHSTRKKAKSCLKKMISECKLKTTTAKRSLCENNHPADVCAPSSFSMITGPYENSTFQTETSLTHILSLLTLLLRTWWCLCYDAAEPKYQKVASSETCHNFCLACRVAVHDGNACTGSLNSR